MAHTFRGEDAHQMRKASRVRREDRQTKRGVRKGYGSTDFGDFPNLKGSAPRGGFRVADGLKW